MSPITQVDNDIIFFVTWGMDSPHRVILSDYEDNNPWRIDRLRSVMSSYQDVCDHFDFSRCYVPSEPSEPYARKKITYIQELHDRKGNLLITLNTTENEIVQSIKYEMESLWRLHNEPEENIQMFESNNPPPGTVLFKIAKKNKNLRAPSV